MAVFRRRVKGVRSEIYSMKFLFRGKSIFRSCKTKDRPTALKRERDLRRRLELEADGQLPEQIALRSAEEEIRELKSALYTAWTTLIAILPEPVHEIMTTYRQILGVSEVAEYIRWEIEVSQRLVEYAATTATEGFVGQEGPLAFCPLCRKGVHDWLPDSPRGFVIPRGLTRHFQGGGSAAMCPVLGLGRRAIMKNIGGDTRM